MELEFEQRVVHNAALGAVILWNFSIEYFSYTSQIEGPDLPKLLLILPMTFHRKTSETIRGMKRSSGLLKALADQPLIQIGLQQRLLQFADCTNSSLLWACSAGLVRMDTGDNWPRLIPVERSPKTAKELSPSSEDVRDMLKVTKRLGPWFAETSTEALFLALDLRF